MRDLVGGHNSSSVDMFKNKPECGGCASLGLDEVVMVADNKKYVVCKNKEHVKRKSNRWGTFFNNETTGKVWGNLWGFFVVGFCLFARSFVCSFVFKVCGNSSLGALVLLATGWTLFRSVSSETDSCELTRREKDFSLNLQTIQLLKKKNGHLTFVLGNFL